MILSYGAYAIAGLAAAGTRQVVAAITFAYQFNDGPWHRAGHATIVTASFLAAGVIANHYSVFIHHLRAQREELHTNVLELERSRRFSIAAEERTCRRISEMLHGRVQTRLLMAQFRLAEAEAVFAHNPVRAMDLVRRAREHEVRQASHLLHPYAVSVRLTTAIQMLAKRFHEWFTVDIHADPSVEDMDKALANKLPVPMRLIAYRAVEEALSNAYRHSDAHRVTISMAVRNGTHLEVTVSDNGSGFDITQMTPGLGLHSIASRVGQCGGAWNIVSAPGLGATLTVTLPLSTAAYDTPEDWETDLPPLAAAPVSQHAEGVFTPAPGAATPQR